MSQITPVMLNDTLNLIQLARETARVQGQKAQAERLTPLVDGLRTIVNESHEAQTATAKAPLQASGVMAQDDFRTLLSVVQRGNGSGAHSLPSSSPTERNTVVTAMAAGGMTDIDIARQMGMTRDEVRLILSMSQRRTTTEITE